jgi:hypothetical protein
MFGQAPSSSKIEEYKSDRGENEVEDVGDIDDDD